MGKLIYGDVVDARRTCPGHVEDAVISGVARAFYANIQKVEVFLGKWKSNKD